MSGPFTHVGRDPINLRGGATEFRAPAAFLRARTAEAIIPGGYLVKDGDGVTLAYVYGKEPDRISASQL